MTLITFVCLICKTLFLVFKGFAVPKEKQDEVVKFSYQGQPASIKHGSVVIAAITSCTNTSNPSVMIGAALVAKKAFDLGLEASFYFFSTTLALR